MEGCWKRDRVSTAGAGGLTRFALRRRSRRAQGRRNRRDATFQLRHQSDFSCVAAPGAAPFQVRAAGRHSTAWWRGLSTRTARRSRLQRRYAGRHIAQCDGTGESIPRFGPLLSPIAPARDDPGLERRSAKAAAARRKGESYRGRWRRRTDAKSIGTSITQASLVTVLPQMAPLLRCRPSTTADRSPGMMQRWRRRALA